MQNQSLCRYSLQPNQYSILQSKPDEDSDPGTTTLIRLREFNNSAWSEMVEQHFNRIYRWCLEAGLEPHAAADVTQEVFVSALGSMHRFQSDETGSFGGWIRRICQRRIADFLRSRQDTGIGGTDAVKMFSQLTHIKKSLLEENQNETTFSMDDDRVLEAVAVAQAEFASNTWRAFWMSTVEGFTTTETAFELGITKNAVYLAKSRITKRLRQLLVNLN